MQRTVDSHTVSIFIGGCLDLAIKACGEYCDAVGLCVTVTSTTYVFTGGSCPGVIVGLINYPRFPSSPEAIWDRAKALAALLCEQLDQQSYSVQSADRTIWVSYRPEDN